METKKIFLLLILFPLCLYIVFAQTAQNVILPDEADDAQRAASLQEEANYYIDRSGNEPRFIQRLIWEEGRYVYRYEVVVEKLEQTGYIEVDRVSVEVNYAEVSLTVGQYRYRVEVYDLFDELSSITPWWQFEIIRAIQPSLSSFNPRIFYLDEDEVWEISVRGQNLTSRSVFYLVQGSRRIHPVSVEIEGNSANLVFSGNSLVTGEYDIYAVNPGGLDAQQGPFTITNRKLTDLNISLGYSPIIPLYGFLFKDTPEIQAPFTGAFYPLGISAKISFIPIKRVWGNFGIEASGSFAMLEQESEFYTAGAFLLDTHLNLLYQKYFFKRTFSVNIGIGAGFTSLLNLSYKFRLGSSTEDINSTYLSAAAGVSFSYFINRSFFINAGVDFIHVFSILAGDSPMPAFIRPFVGAGMQL